MKTENKALSLLFLYSTVYPSLELSRHFSIVPFSLVSIPLYYAPMLVNSCIMADNELLDSETTVHRNGGDCVDLAVEKFVYDFLREHLRMSGFEWTYAAHSRDTARTIEADVGAALRCLADDFNAHYKEQVTEMCAQLNLNAETVRPTVEGVANELFCEGIKWARIVAFFVFGGELAVHFKDSDAVDLITILAHAITVYVSVTLLPWINHHGGWNGLIEFKDEGKDTLNTRWPSVKNLLYLGISAIGAITLGAVLSKS